MIKIKAGPDSQRASVGFTLVEVLISVALTGLIASLAFAPTVYVARQVTEKETSYSDETALRRAAMFMAQDVAQGLRLAETVVRIIPHEELGGGRDDTLIVASSAQVKQNLPAGSVAYRVARRSPFTDGTRVGGLYRWLLPGVLPESCDHEKLETEEGQLVIPYVSEMSLSVCAQPEWLSEYSGKLPPGMKFVLSRDRGADGEDMANGGKESVEYVVALPK